MEPENDGFQEKSPFPGADFQVHHVKLQDFISDHSVHSNVLCVCCKYLKPLVGVLEAEEEGFVNVSASIFRGTGGTGPIFFKQKGNKWVKILDKTINKWMVFEDALLLKGPEKCKKSIT